MLRCVAEPALGAAEAALDFFAALAAVLLAERAPALRAPLAQGLARALLGALAYPIGFTAWEDAEVDEDAFNRFRRAPAFWFCCMPGCRRVMVCRRLCIVFTHVSGTRTCAVRGCSVVGVQRGHQL